MAEKNKPAPDAASKGGRKNVDWDLVEADYRAGVKSLREMAEAHGVSHVAIKKRADKEGWVRDLSAKIQAKADEKVNRAVVNATVNAEARAVTESAVVEANADAQSRVRLEHRADIARTRSLFRTLLEELEVASDKEGQALIEKLAEIVNAPAEDESADDARKRAERMRKLLSQVLDGPARIDSAKRLTEMLEKVVRLEREAYGIDNNKGGEGGYEDLLRRIANQESA
jgi:phage-related tail fiber protein